MEAVNNPADVMVPVPVVEMLPVVESVPSSLMVKLGVPFDWMDSDVLVPALVSLITKAVPVPALVRLRDV